MKKSQNNSTNQSQEQASIEASTEEKTVDIVLKRRDIEKGTTTPDPQKDMEDH